MTPDSLHDCAVKSSVHVEFTDNVQYYVQLLDTKLQASRSHVFKNEPKMTGGPKLLTKRYKKYTINT